MMADIARPIDDHRKTSEASFLNQLLRDPFRLTVAVAEIGKIPIDIRLFVVGLSARKDTVGGDIVQGFAAVSTAELHDLTCAVHGMRLEDGISVHVVYRGPAMENQIGMAAKHLIVVYRQP